MGNDNDFKLIVVVWLSILTLVWVGVVIWWQPLCERAAMTVLGSLEKAAAREVVYYSPPPPAPAAADQVDSIPEWYKRQLDSMPTYEEGSR